MVEKDDMKQETECNCKDWNEKDWRKWKHYRHHHYRRGGGGGAVYGLGFVGALIYFIGAAGNFWAGVLGFFQAMVWPAYLVYEAFKFLIK